MVCFRYERKLEEDIKNYNPFGRGGGGAPIKDGSGNAIGMLAWQVWFYDLLEF